MKLKYLLMKIKTKLKGQNYEKNSFKPLLFDGDFTS